MSSTQVEISRPSSLTILWILILYCMLIAQVPSTSPDAPPLQKKGTLSGLTPENKAELEKAKKLEKDQVDSAIAIYKKYQEYFGEDYSFHVHLGQLYLKAGKNKSAISNYDIAMKINSDDLELMLVTANLCEEEGMFVQMAHWYLVALQRTPRNKKFQQKYMDAVAKTGIRGDMKRAYEYISKKDPTAHEALYRLAKVQLELREKSKAYSNMLLALNQDPKNREYQITLAASIETEEQIKKHLEILKKLAGEPDAHGSIKNLAGWGYSMEGNGEAAFSLYQEVSQSDKTYLTKNPYAVEAFFVKNNFTISRELAESYLLHFPDDKKIKRIQVLCYQKLDVDGVRHYQVLSEWIQLEPGTKIGWLQLAKFEVKDGKKDSAVQHGKIWVDRNPESVEGFEFLLKLIEEDEEETKTVQKILLELIKLNPKTAKQNWIKLGELQYRMGNYEEAKRTLHKVSKSHEMPASAWHVLGLAQLKSGNEKQAKQTLKISYQSQPENAEFAKSFGNVLEDSAELQNNLKLFQFINVKSPSLAERIKLAKSYYLNGEFFHAESEWSKIWVDSSAIIGAEPFFIKSLIKTDKLEKALPYYHSRDSLNSKDLGVLDTLSRLHKHTKNWPKYWSTVKRIVDLDPLYKDYQKTHSQFLMENGNLEKARKHLKHWANRYPWDKQGMELLMNCAQSLKDTATLYFALSKLTKVKDSPQRYHFLEAEIRYLKFGKTDRLQELVEQNPEYKSGTELLIQHFYNKGDLPKLVKYESYLLAHSGANKKLFAPLADLLNYQKRRKDANEAYYQAIMAGNREKGFYARALKTGSNHGSPHLLEILKIGSVTFPEDRNLKFQYAKHLGKTEKGIQVLNELLKEDPQFLEALMEIVIVSIKLKDTSTAIHWLKKWCKMVPTETRPWDLLAKIYKAKKDTSNWVDGLEKLFKASPKDHKLAAQIGAVHLRLGNLGPSEKYFSQAVALLPNDLEYQKQYGLVLSKREKYAKSENPLRKVFDAKGFDEQVCYALYKAYMEKKKYKDSRTQLQVLVERHPGKKEYVYPLAKLQVQLKNPLSAIQILEYPPIQQALNGEMSRLLVDQYLYIKDNLKIQAFGVAITKHHPKFVPQELGNYFFEAQMNERALLVLDTLIRYNPSSEAYYKRAVVAFRRNNWETASFLFEEGRAFSKEADRYLGKCFLHLKEYEKAIAAFEDYYKNKKKGETLKTLYKLYERTKDDKGAQKSLEKLVRAFPQDQGYVEKLADAYLKKGDREKAADEYEKILSKNTRHAKANLYVGLRNAEDEKFHIAISRLKIGLGEYPDFTEGWEKLALCYSAVKAYESAKKAQARAKELKKRQSR